MVTESIITGKKIKLREKNLSDAHNDFTWATDPELARLDATPLLDMPFSHYLMDYASELHYSLPSRHRFAVESLDGMHIGNCTYYDVDEARGEAELGVMIGDRDYWDKGYGTDTVTTLVNHVFRETHLGRIHLKTLDWNHRAMRCFQKCDFILYGQLYRDGYSFITMDITHKQWEEQRTDKNE